MKSLIDGKGAGLRGGRAVPASAWRLLRACWRWKWWRSCYSLNAKKQHGGQCSVSLNLHTPLALGSKINVASAASLRPHLHKAEILKV